MPFDFGRLKSSLAQSKTQQENNALYQTILALIEESNVEFVDTAAIIAQIQSQLAGLGAVQFVNVDTSGAASSFELADYLTPPNKPVVFKDITGNAAANNITLNGTVDGVVNPVINTNFGVMRVYKNDVDGSFNEW